jgi:hypothetical protein
VVESKSPGTEPARRPKDITEGWITSCATTGPTAHDEGAKAGQSNCTTLPRDPTGCQRCTTSSSTT